MAEKPELLAPAGSPDSLIAAVEAGADAVYLAGKRFGARKSASNFSDAELRDALRYVHLSGAKAYVAVNTLLYDDELAGALSFLADVYSWGADAAILQDVGLASLAREHVPIELHASTQFGVHDTAGAEAAKELGFSRAIVARETPITDVAEISEAIGTEIFVHGALCYAHSGQCLMSSFIGGRSGNRGSCSQPCRMEYAVGGDSLHASGPYLLSTRDLNTLDRLGEIVGAGVRALKIEGRMRSPEYVALATSAYRKALDSGELPDAGTARMLALAFNREFTRGYSLGARHASLTNHSSQGNAGLRLGKVLAVRGQWARMSILEGMSLTPGDGIGVGESGGIVLAVEQARRGIVEVKIDFPARDGDEVRLTSSRSMVEAAKNARSGRKRLIDVGVGLEPGKAVRMTAASGDLSVELAGPVAAEADKRPLSEESVKTAVGSLGDTPFDVGQLDISIVGRPFVPVSALKEMRRSLVASLERKVSESFLCERPEARAPVLPKTERTKNEPKLVARTRDPGVAGKLLDAGAGVVLVDALYGLPSADLGFLSELSGTDGIAIEMPRVTMNSFWRALGPGMDSWRGPVMAHSLGARKRVGKAASLGGFSLNVANSRSARDMSAHFASVEASPETSAREVASIASVADAWVAVQGRQEVMVSEDCIAGSEGGCDKCEGGGSIGTGDGGGGSEGCAQPERGRAQLVRRAGERAEDGGWRVGVTGARRLFTIQDLKGYRFPALVDGDCRTHVFNSAETCLADDLVDVVKTGAGGLVLNLQLKEARDAAEIVRLYRKMLAAALAGFKPSGMDLRALKTVSGPSLTRGHFAERAP